MSGGLLLAARGEPPTKKKKWFRFRVLSSFFLSFELSKLSPCKFSLSFCVCCDLYL